MSKLLIIGLYILIIAVASMIPIKFTNYLNDKKNILLNRWIYAFTGFVLVMIPQFMASNLPKFIEVGLYVLFFFLIMMFFETSRINNEKKNLKTMFDYTWLAKRTIKK
ncbi:hypothetical protein [Clostridium paraputrificum]|jgi:Ca2+/Na+ antiporter|uniref:hypothetical protein n=1 Tax=Clostridium paraputrificum TaxID=29363 RepID=UPI00066594F6|nr:hypothetical protein [Clostridium paraputrificum]MDB2074910.1 hypothetical protein [Clostridium paraputrificum]MDB2078307.1 hypothetical protein [Clostridium paraputrificum]MDB2091756.1 hypothetical protein [Clostridium paraputrificum]MDB2098721.1 hypothetical protein [Clostridium paraputrificum]MDB2106157.1 hypothetical protein [Clostridium paraputrificum]